MLPHQFLTLRVFDFPTNAQNTFCAAFQPLSNRVRCNENVHVLHTEESSEAKGSQKWRKSSLRANIKYGKIIYSKTLLGGSCSTYLLLSNLDVICDL